MAAKQDRPSAPAPGDAHVYLARWEGEDLSRRYSDATQPGELVVRNFSADPLPLPDFANHDVLKMFNRNSAADTKTMHGFTSAVCPIRSRAKNNVRMSTPRRRVNQLWLA